MFGAGMAQHRSQCPSYRRLFSDAAADRDVAREGGGFEAQFRIRDNLKHR